MAEPARRLVAVPSPAEVAPRRRPALFADHIPAQPIAPPQPTQLQRLVQALATAFVPAVLLLAAAILWRL